MNTKLLKDEPITMMFTDRVKPEKIKEYEEWLRGIHNEAKKFDGFIEANVIKPTDTVNPEYITLVKFDNQENLTKWKKSSIEAEYLAKLPDLIEHTADMQKASGLELWFNRPKVLVSADPPAFWKQVVLGVITVYPMILILNFILKPITGNLPWLASLFISVVVLSSLLTYPVMPVATKLLSNWLYPKSTGSK